MTADHIHPQSIYKLSTNANGPFAEVCYGLKDKAN